MTIQSNQSRATYAGDNVSTAFPVPFLFFANVDISVVKTAVGGVVATLTLNVDYTLVGAGLAAGGTLTKTTALLTGETLTIFLDPPRTQLSHYLTNDIFPASTLETNLDRTVQISQRLYDLIARSIRAPDGDAAPSMQLPAAAQRANLGLVFDSNGNVTVGNLTSAAFNASQSFTATAGQTVFTLSVAAAISNVVIVSLDGAVLVPGIDYTVSGNKITLTSGALAGQTLYVTASIAFSPLNPITATESSQSVTPTFFSYPVSPKVDPRRYGAVGDGVTDDTVAMQTALNIANANHGRLIIPDNFNASCGALALTFSGTRATNGLSIEGMSINGSRITQRGTPAALLTFTGATPAGAPTECLLVMENFTINQATNAKTADGIVFNNLASIRLSNVLSRGFTQALHLKSSLIINIDQGCQFTDSNYGILIEGNGVGGSTCNLIVIEESRINLNSTWGVWFENGDQLHLRSNDLEGNGTAANLNSGGIRIRGNLAPVALVAGVLLERNWLESNLGTGILVDAPTGGVVTDIQIIGGNVLAQELNAGTRNSITVNGATRLAIENLKCVTPNDTWALTCGQAFLKNTIASVLGDAGITTPTYINVNEGGRGLMAAGRREIATLTLTGVSGTVTQVVTIIQQGDIIRVIFADFLGTSTTTSCGITGLPIKYAPSVSRFLTTTIEDSGTDLPQSIVVAAGGTMTLFKTGVAAGFTASGQKGLRACELTWRL